MIPIKTIEKGVASYLDNELMSKLPATGLERVLIGTAISLGIRRSEQTILGLKDNKVIQTLGIMDTEGNVDVDVVAEELKKNIPNDGVKVDVPMIGGLTFHKSDVDKLYQYIMDK